MEIVEAILTKNPCYKAGKKIDVKGLMLHSICSPQPSAKVLIHNWNRSGCENKCAHAFIDANTGVVYQTLPFNHRGRHCGRNAETGKTGNDTYLGIEMCEPPQVKYNRDGTVAVGEWVKDSRVIECVKRTYESAVELFADLCTKFEIDPKTGIVSHREAYERGFANNKRDPEHLWEVLELPYTMDGFRSDVIDRMNGDNSVIVERGASKGEEVYSAPISESTSNEKTVLDKESETEPAYDESFFDFVSDEEEALIEEDKPESISPDEAPKMSIQVRIDVDNLRVRSGQGTEYEPPGKYTGVGVFTVEEIQNGSGSKAGWGRSKSGIGWICLDYVKPMIGAI